VSVWCSSKAGGGRGVASSNPIGLRSTVTLSDKRHDLPMGSLLFFAIYFKLFLDYASSFWREPPFGSWQKFTTSPMGRLSAKGYLLARFCREPFARAFWSLASGSGSRHFVGSP
jgi:hypothetical protein